MRKSIPLWMSKYIGKLFLTIIRLVFTEDMPSTDRIIKLLNQYFESKSNHIVLNWWLKTLSNPCLFENNHMVRPCIWKGNLTFFITRPIIIYLSNIIFESGYFIESFIWIWTCLGGDIIETERTYYINLPWQSLLVHERNKVIVIRFHCIRSYVLIVYYVGYWL